MANFFEELIDGAKKAITGVQPIITAATPIVTAGIQIVEQIDPAAKPIITAGEEAVQAAMALIAKAETAVAGASPELTNLAAIFGQLYTLIKGPQVTVLAPTTTAATTPAVVAAATTTPISVSK